jgi:hypothetical protein
MASKREDIVAHIVTQITSITDIKKVTRDPIDITQLSRESFPHVLIETANESRENASFGSEVRRVAELDVILNVIVMGNNRDQKRNTAIEQIEEKLMEDSTLGGNATDCQLLEVVIREIGESDPYGQAAMVFRCQYFYSRTDA